MNTRSKLIAAFLGLVVAAGAVGDASARTITKTVKTHGVIVKTTKITEPHRLWVGTRIAKRIRIVRHAPVIGVTKIVRVIRRPLIQKQAFAHRLVVRKTIVR